MSNESAKTSTFVACDSYNVSARQAFIVGVLLFLSQALLGRYGNLFLGALIYASLSFLTPFFIFSILSNSKKTGELALMSIIVGPAVSAAIGTGAMYAKLGSSHAALAIPLVGLIAGAIETARGVRYEFKKPGLTSVFPVVFTLIIFVLVAAPILSTLRMRALHSGWFHVAAAWRILNFGVPPEDPIFPGEGIHNYWFYHAWGALISSATGRSPFDAFSIVNLHAIVAVVVGIWALTGLFGDNHRFRKISLFIAVLGMNAIGCVYYAMHKIFAFTYMFKSHKPFIFYGYLTLFGDFRIPDFLVKFIPPNGFPIGIQMFVAGLVAATAIVSEPKRKDWAVVLFFASYGEMLFHPTSGLGLYATIGVGLISLFFFNGGLRKIPWALVIAPGVAGVLSLPYLFAVFPAESESMSLGFWWVNAWYLMQPYILSYPLLVRGVGNVFRFKTPARLFTFGGMVGIIIASLFFLLPGQNQYKFIQLTAIQAGIIAGASFIEDTNMRWKKIFLTALVLGAIATTGILAKFYLTSEWSRKEIYAYEGMHVYPTGSKNDQDKRFFEWIHKDVPKDAVIFTYYNQIDAALCSERSMFSALQDWVSKGHADQAKRSAMVKGFFTTPEPIKKEDLDYLRALHRPVYVVYPPVLLSKRRILAKFVNDKTNFDIVYQQDEYRVFKLK